MNKSMDNHKVTENHLKQKFSIFFNSLEYKAKNLSRFVKKIPRNLVHESFHSDIMNLISLIGDMNDKLMKCIYRSDRCASLYEKDDICEGIQIIMKKMLNLARDEQSHMVKMAKYWAENKADKEVLDHLLKDWMDSIESMGRFSSLFCDFVFDGTVMFPEEEIDYEGLLTSYRMLGHGEPEVPSPPFRILLLETDEDIKKTIRSILDVSGRYEVDIYSDVLSVTAILKIQHYDAVVTNTLLGKGNNPMKLVSEMQDANLRLIPIIMINSIDDHEFVSAMHKDNVTMVHSPFSHIDFFNVLERDIRISRMHKKYKQTTESYRVLSQVLNKSGILVMITNGLEKIVFFSKGTDFNIEDGDEKSIISRSCRDVNICQSNNKCDTCQKALMENREYLSTVKLKSKGKLPVLAEVRIVPIEKGFNRYLVRFFTKVQKPV